MASSREQDRGPSAIQLDTGVAHHSALPDEEVRAASVAAGEGAQSSDDRGIDLNSSYQVELVKRGNSQSTYRRVIDDADLEIDNEGWFESYVRADGKSYPCFYQFVSESVHWFIEPSAGSSGTKASSSRSKGKAKKR